VRADPNNPIAMVVTTNRILMDPSISITVGDPLTTYPQKEKEVSQIERPISLVNALARIVLNVTPIMSEMLSRIFLRDVVSW
jgi:hypothetical protein